MKNKLSRFPLMFLLSFLIFAVSCSKDDSAEDEQEGEYLTATIDGENFTSNLSITMTEMIDITSIGGVSSNNQSIMLQLSKTDPGTYSIGGPNSTSFTIAGYTASTSSGIKTWQAPLDQSVSDGQIVVTSSSEDNIKGTFSFTATNTGDNTTVEVTNGKFNINF